MCRISTPAAAATAELFSRTKKMAGSVHNTHAAIGSLQPALRAVVLDAEAVLAAGSLSKQDIETVKLTVSAATGCDYCVAAHSLLGQLAGLRPDAVRNVREGTLVATSGTISGGATAPAETRAASPAADELGWTLAEVLAARRARAGALGAARLEG